MEMRASKRERERERENGKARPEKLNGGPTLAEENCRQGRG